MALCRLHSRKGELSAANVRRALAFGEFSTLLGDVRYAIPPDLIDETVTQTGSSM